MPGHIREEDARGFALAPGEMVLTGGAGEVLNIARPHVRDIPV
jgi:pyruvate dehydrogenase (quinone)